MRFDKPLIIYVFLLTLLILNFIYGESILLLIYTSLIALGFLTIIMIIALNIRRKSRRHVSLTLSSFLILLIVVILMLQGVL